MKPPEVGDVTLIVRSFDPLTLSDRIRAVTVAPEQDWSDELLRQADGEHLVYDGQTIRLNVENGSWIWRVTGHDRLRGLVHSRWPD